MLAVGVAIIQLVDPMRRAKWRATCGSTSCVGFEPGDEAGCALGLAAFAEAHVRMHVVLFSPHGLGHGVQARAVRVGRREHVVLALLPAPEHLI